MALTPIGQYTPTSWSRLAGAYGVVLAMATYYVLFYFPPRLVGRTDPDRYYHLGLSRIISEHGIVKVLPQVEDLGWGRIFPEKEFLFHALTGSADWIGGSPLVLLLVPALGIAIVACLYFELSRIIRPLHAALLCCAVPLLSARFLFRLTLLRPHVLAILCFCLLLVTILRNRPKLAALAAAGFALSYHAFYIVILVAGAAWLFRNRMGHDGGKTWLWVVCGLLVGIIINPFFPSNLIMSWFHVQIALGINSPPNLNSPLEFAWPGWTTFLLTYGFVPVSLAFAAVALTFRQVVDEVECGRFRFLFVLTLFLFALALKSDRAMEYALPACILLVGYCGRVFAIPWWIPFNFVLLVAGQGYMAQAYYSKNWIGPQRANFDEYADAIALLPPNLPNAKVFNCEWWAGAYLLNERPDLRFVDVLDPTFLWRESPEKYVGREALIKGKFADPHAILRGAFRADFVLCASPPLINQMYADPQHFQPVRGSDSGPVRVFSVQP